MTYSCIMDFDLDTFLKNHKPATLDFTPYLKLKKLQGYERLDMKNMDNLGMLRKWRTYVKYIRDGDAFSDKKYKTHVKCGGIFVTGGVYRKKKFTKTSDHTEWTHIVLKRQPYPVGKEPTELGFGMKNVYDYDPHVFVVKLKNKYVFYKHFGFDYD